MQISVVTCRWRRLNHVADWYVIQRQSASDWIPIHGLIFCSDDALWRENSTICEMKLEREFLSVWLSKVSCKSRVLWDDASVRADTKYALQAKGRTPNLRSFHPVAWHVFYPIMPPQKRFSRPPP